MTERHTGYLVTLEAPIREDDAEATIAAIRHIKGVIDVRPIVAGMEQMSGAVRMESDWRKAMVALLENGPRALIKLDD